jgi:hypothetical protein
MFDIVGLLLISVILLTPAIIIIIIIDSRRKARNEAEKGLNEAQEEHIRVIETGSNFRTRVSDLKESMGSLKASTERRRSLLAGLRGVKENAGGPGRGPEEAGASEQGA